MENNKSIFEKAIAEPYYYSHFSLQTLINVLNRMEKEWGKVRMPVPKSIASRIAESITKEDIISFTTENGHTITMKKGVF